MVMEDIKDRKKEVLDEVEQKKDGRWKKRSPPYPFLKYKAISIRIT